MGTEIVPFPVLHEFCVYTTLRQTDNTKTVAFEQGNRIFKKHDERSTGYMVAKLAQERFCTNYLDLSVS